jgi:serine/threonine protein kinase
MSLLNHGCLNLDNIFDTTSLSPKPVGCGGFGDVYAGTLADGAAVAVKLLKDSGYAAGKALKVSICPDAFIRLLTFLQHTARELYTWSKCDHPNVLPFLGFAFVGGRIAMISPWMQHGTLPEYLARQPHANRCQLVSSQTHVVENQ